MSFTSRLSQAALLQDQAQDAADLCAFLSPLMYVRKKENRPELNKDAAMTLLGAQSPTTAIVALASHVVDSASYVAYRAL